MALSEQERQQFLTMLSQSLMQHLLPYLQQFSQQAAQQAVAAAQRATPNFWTVPIVVRRDPDINSPNEFDEEQTTPAQLLAEMADLLLDLNATMDEVEKKLGSSKPARRRRGAT